VVQAKTFFFFFFFLLWPLGVAEPLPGKWVWLKPNGVVSTTPKGHGGGSATPKTGLGGGSTTPCGPKGRLSHPFNFYFYFLLKKNP
jgi:hypothetical protein